MSNTNGKTLLQSYNIFLNSKNRDIDYYNYISSGTPNYLAYCGWNLKQIIKKTSLSSYFTISVKSLILPFSFDNISTLNKEFEIEYLSSYYMIVLEEGNPNITQLITDIKNKIILAVPALTGFLTINYDSASQTISILNTSPNTLTMYFQNNFIGKMCGFTTNINILSGTSATSDININVNPLECIFVRSDNLSFSSSYESIVSKNNISDIIAIIPITVSSGNYIVYNDSSSFESRLNDDRIDNISIYLTSAVDDDHILSLNLNWTIQLQINEYKFENGALERINLNPIEEPLPLIKQSKDENKEGEKEIEFLKEKEKELEKQLNDLLLKKKIKDK